MYAVYLTIYSGKRLPPLYIGSTSIEKIKNGYYGSVVSKKYKLIFKEELKQHPELFNIKILSTHDTRKKAIEFELYLQKYFDVVKSDLFFNEAFASINGMFGRDVAGENNPMFGKKHNQITKQIIREKRGNEKRYNITDKHKEIISKTHKGKKLSDEIKELISKNKKGKNSGLNNPMYGKKHSDYTKKKISKSNKGRVVSNETKEKISKSNKGKFISEEVRKKISEAKKGIKRNEFSNEWKEKISKSNKGRVVSNETREKLKLPRKSKQSICPYCKKEGAGGNMKRYHFEKCKLNDKK
jgi:hypothetical protein